MKQIIAKHDAQHEYLGDEMSPRLIDLDYSVIDKSLLGTNRLRCKHIAKVNGAVPPQGYPFMDKVKSLVALMSKLAPRYRD